MAVLLAAYQEKLQPGRVAIDHRAAGLLMQAEHLAVLAQPRLHHVQDFVAIEHAAVGHGQ